MAATDKILQEAQNIMALQNTDTPLKAALKSTLVFNLNLLYIWIDHKGIYKIFHTNGNPSQPQLKRKTLSTIYIALYVKCGCRVFYIFHTS